MRTLFVALILVTTHVAAAEAPYPAATLAVAESLRVRALAEARPYEIVESLTTEVGARPAGSEGDRKAVAWAVAKLKALGFQNVRAEPVTVPHWQRGPAGLELLGTQGGSLAAEALGGSVASPAAGVEGEVLRVESVAELKALPLERIKGRIVYYDRPMARTRDGSTYRPAQTVRAQGTAEAGRRGAVGVVIRSIGTSSGAVIHTGSMRYDEVAPKIPSVAISNDDADALTRRIAAAQGLRLRLKVDARRHRDERSANVIGEIPGQTDEIVLLGAHLDSWDLATGANDDAAGVAIVTEAARLAGSLGKPRRTLRVVLFANEEFGFSGAREYVRAHAATLDRHVLAMEADFGAGASYELSGRVGADHVGAIRGMAQLLAPLGVAYGNNLAGGGPDLGPFRERGVPVLEPEHDGTLYFDTHHTVNDTLDRIDREGLQQNVAVYAVAAYLASEYGPGFGRLPVTAAE